MVPAKQTGNETTWTSKRSLSTAGVLLTVKDQVQGLVSHLGVAKLDVFVRVPGEAGPQQPDPGHPAGEVVVEELEGV